MLRISAWRAERTPLETSYAELLHLGKILELESKEIIDFFFYVTEPVNGGRIPGLRASMLAVRETPAVQVRKNVTLNNSFSPFIVVAFSSSIWNALLIRAQGLLET